MVKMGQSIPHILTSNNQLKPIGVATGGGGGETEDFLTMALANIGIPIFTVGRSDKYIFPQAA